MKIVGNTSSQEECDQIEDIVKTFLVGQHARHLATIKTDRPHPKKHPNHPDKTLLPEPSPNINEKTLFTVKGLT